MPFVKVPGSDREIWFDLHEPQEQESPWFASVGTAVELTPEQFASEMQSSTGFTQTHQVLRVGAPRSRGNLAVMARNANAFEIARRKLIPGRTGRSRQIVGFTQSEDFALIVLHFEALGCKQAIRKALEYWLPAAANPPARRHIEEALRRVRSWVIEDPYLAADAARKRCSLPELPRTMKRRTNRGLN